MGLIKLLKNLYYRISQNEVLNYRQKGFKRSVEVNFDMMNSTLDNNSLEQDQKELLKKRLFNDVILSSFKAVGYEADCMTAVLDELDRHEKYSHNRRIFVYEEALTWLLNKEYLEKIDIIKRSNLTRKNKNQLLSELKGVEFNFDELIGYMDVKTVEKINEQREKERLESSEKDEEEAKPTEDTSQSSLLADERSEEENQVIEEESQQSDFEEEQIETTSIEVVESEEESEIEENGVLEDEEEKEENEEQKKRKQLDMLFSC